MADDQEPDAPLDMFHNSEKFALTDVRSLVKMSPDGFEKS